VEVYNVWEENYILGRIYVYEICRLKYKEILYKVGI
jgi:hypothetical protein